MAQRLKQVQTRIEAACARADRDPSTVRLILVTKTIGTAQIRAALEQGACLLGENKAQELRDKAPLLVDTPARWHFIGQLQSNKLKDVLPWVEMIHSLDRLSLAEKLNARLEAEGRRLQVLVQVNTSGETSKAGIAPEQALGLISQLGALPALELKGLMTIGLNSPDQAQVRAGFRQLRQLRDQARELPLPDPSLPELSMGMSGDFEMAIAEGATLVRIGSAIFGARNP
ncbi:MAG: YggS family pyridoxal phosphate-dependent enzyme [Candidatus Melainabacteria bacterium HGW-Melainabacteria-1]|nr:MAG: YggS family pyridoxal phosphate-dependent enzyme [Candidatus Melainabacteria bacterium HGW-Melainabacteria-1]